MMPGAKERLSLFALLLLGLSLLGLALCSVPAVAGQHSGSLPTPSKPASHLGPHDYVQYKFTHRAYSLSRCPACARDSGERIPRKPQARHPGLRNTRPTLLTGANGRSVANP
jgi:hypothetical protein